MYSSFGRKVFEAKDANEAGLVINELLEKLKERMPTQSEFMAGFDQIHLTNSNTKQASLVRYILKGFASHQKLAFSDDAANLTIEHIYPQSKMDGQWTPEVVGSLGNLILLTSADNGKIKNDDFSKKLITLKSLTGSVPKDVLDAKDWTIERVKQRTQQMAETAYNQIWNIA